jgi:hypothetical protein
MTHRVVMAGLVPPTRAEALVEAVRKMRFGGRRPGHHAFDPK